jgi:hypothetical protein
MLLPNCGFLPQISHTAAIGAGYQMRWSPQGLHYRGRDG